MRAQLADSVEDRVIQAGVFLGSEQSLLVGLNVDEIQGVGRAQAGINELVTGVKKKVESLARPDPEVVLALGTNAEVGFEVGFKEGLAAARALGPETFGANSFFLVSVALGAGQVAALALKPRHKPKTLYMAASPKAQIGSVQS